MRKIALFLFGMFMSLAAVYAQSPAPEPDTLKDPVLQTDPSAATIPAEVKYKKDQLKLTPKELPAAVRQTLEASPQYKGWEKAVVHKDKKENTYSVEITKSDTTRTFHFDKMGRPLKD